MKAKNDVRRVLIAVTESGMAHDLWRVALQHAADTPSDLVAVFVRDDRWQRAASLPFTREVPRTGGPSTDFTRQRAREVDDDAVTQARQEVEALAAEARLEAAFETLAESELTRLEEFIAVGESLLVVPAMLKQRPAYNVLTRLKCRLVVVEPGESVGDA